MELHEFSRETTPPPPSWDLNFAMGETGYERGQKLAISTPQVVPCQQEGITAITEAHELHQR